MRIQNRLNCCSEILNLENREMLATFNPVGQSLFSSADYDSSTGELSLNFDAASLSKSQLNQFRKIDSLSVGSGPSFQFSGSQAFSKKTNTVKFNVGKLESANGFSLNLFDDNIGKAQLDSLDFAAANNFIPSPIKPATPQPSKTTPSPKTASTLTLANQDQTPLSRAVYDQETGSLDLTFDYDKVLGGGKWSNARHIDALKVGTDVFEIELHADNGPKNSKGQYIYNRSTVENQFNLNIGKNRGSGGELNFALTDHADGRKQLFNVNLK